MRLQYMYGALHASTFFKRESKENQIPDNNEVGWCTIPQNRVTCSTTF